MKNKKKTVTIIAIIGIGLAIIGGIGFYTCYHTWNAATCTRPRTCSICGKTEGESKGHTWSNATCTKPQTCTVCKQTKGKALGHDSDSWTTIKEAICNEAGEKEATCKRCGKSLTQEIPKTDHTPGEWKVTADYKINRDGTVIPGTQAIQCTVCNKELKTKEYTIELTNNRGPIYNVVHQLKKKGKIEANGIGEYRICKQSVEPVKKGRMEFSNKQKNQLEVSIGNIEMYVDKYKKFDWINCSDEELQDARSNVTRLLDLAKKVEKEFKKI